MANFPRNLAIRPSNPSSAFSCFTGTNYALKAEGSPSNEDALVASQELDIQSYGIAGRIWEAAYAMIIYVDPPTLLEFDPQCSVSHGQGAVVELGAGTGFLGFRLAQILSQQRSPAISLKSLVLTDLESVCPLLERNRQQEVGVASDLSGVGLAIRPLEWGNLEHGNRIAAELNLRDPSTATVRADSLLSHIVCSDLVYFTELLAPLLRTLLQLSSPPFSTTEQPVQVVISYMIRSLSKEAPFWAAFGTWFNFSPVLVRHKAGWERFGSRDDRGMFVFVATRKPESLVWAVPDDVALMRGGDDTFETLLLMNMFNGD